MVAPQAKPTSPQVSLNSVPRVHEEAALVKVGGRWFATTADGLLHPFVSPTGEVSEVGERLAELIDGNRSVRSMVEVLVEEFDVTTEVAEVDTLKFIGLLAAKHVLTF